ncbi:MAG: methylmalonyl-CoA mutase family protein [Dehalococcoidia bacterium]
MDGLEKKLADWEERSQGLPERDGLFVTPSGIQMQRVYTPLDIASQDYLKDLGLPAEHPYTRGVHATGYRGRLWTMRLFSGFGSAEESNRRYKYLLEHGETGLSVAFDFPTLNGYDTDHPLAVGEFGRCGVAVSSLADMEILVDGLPLDSITTSMTINGPAAVIWAMYIAAAEKQGVSLEQMGGTIQNDILKEYTAQNSYIFPPRPSIGLVVDTIEFASQHMPRWNPISISGYHIREAGSTAVQELAFTLVDGFAYVEACLERGLPVDSFAPRLSFFFACHNDFFEEVAKFRAARRIWARGMAERYGAGERSRWLRFHTQTSGCTLTAQQPDINAVRVALQALAAVLGGTQSLHTNSLDEALALPSERAVLIALRTQQIIAHESGVTSSADPLGGSYLVEALTDRMEEESHRYFAEVEAQGGVVAAVEKGFFQQEIANASYRYQQEVDQKKRIIVGVNDYQVPEPMVVPLLKMDEESEKQHLERLDRVRRERSSREVTDSLRELEGAARGGENLMPYILRAVKAYATLGEICDCLRGVFGEYKAPVLV